MRTGHWVSLLGILLMALLPWACGSTGPGSPTGATPTPTFTSAPADTSTNTPTLLTTATATRTNSPTPSATSTSTSGSAPTATTTATLVAPLAYWNAMDGGSSGVAPGYIAVNSAGTSVYLSYNYYVLQATDYDLQMWVSTGASTYSAALTQIAKVPGSSTSSYPDGLAVDSSGNVYADDPNYEMIQYGSSLATPVSIIPYSTTAAAPGTLYLSDGVALDGKGDLFTVENSTTYRVQAFSHTGFSPLFQTDLTGFNPYTSVAVNQAGTTVFCATIHNNGSHIVVLNSSGVSIATWGTSLSNFSVGGMAVAQAGTYAGYLYVTDTNLERVMEFDPSGNLVSTWGVSGTNPGEFQSPAGIAVDGTGNIYVTDALSGLVQKFAPR